MVGGGSLVFDKLSLRCWWDFQEGLWLQEAGSEQWSGVSDRDADGFPSPGRQTLREEAQTCPVGDTCTEEQAEGQKLV